MLAAVDRLREQAEDCETAAVHHHEQGDVDMAVFFKTVEMALLLVAQALDEDE